ncbi:hypothetical protein [Saccharopolyspora spinosa]|uniref:hypothetical protein n=1 Tax=Saccharopolyspora spinosa TaxID=60894 RepID=UPI000237921B
MLVVSFRPDAKAIESTPTLFNGSSLDNYRDVLSSTKGAFRSWFGNSVPIAGLTTVLGVPLAATTAYAASRSHFPGRHWLLPSFLVVQMFPFAVLIVPLYNSLLPLGLQGSVFGLVPVYCCKHRDLVPHLPVEGLLRRDAQRDRRALAGRRAVAVRDVLASRAAAGEAGVGGDGVLLVHHGLERSGVRLGVPLGRDRSKTLALGLQVFAQQNRAEWGHLAAASALVAVPAAERPLTRNR